MYAPQRWPLSIEMIKIQISRREGHTEYGQLHKMVIEKKHILNLVMTTPKKSQSVHIINAQCFEEDSTLHFVVILEFASPQGTLEKDN